MDENKYTEEEVVFLRKALVDASNISKDCIKELRKVIIISSGVTIAFIIAFVVIVNMYFSYVYGARYNQNNKNSNINTNTNINKNDN